MKAGIEDYKKEIHTMVDKIDNLPRIIRLYSFVKKVFEIHNESDNGGLSHEE